MKISIDFQIFVIDTIDEYHKYALTIWPLKTPATKDSATAANIDRASTNKLFHSAHLKRTELRQLTRLAKLRNSVRNINVDPPYANQIT